MNRRLTALCLASLPLLATAPALSDDNDGHRHDGYDRHTWSPIVQKVREATARYLDANAAVAAGYAPDPFCVSGRDEGAMGIHFVNGALIGDGALDVSTPEILIYEPLPGGRLRLLGAEYITFADAWHGTHTGSPALEGHLLNHTGAPNRYAIPAFYEIHVWAWKDNPAGTFADFNPRASCDAYVPPAPSAP